MPGYKIAYEPNLVPSPELMSLEIPPVLEDWFRWSEEWSMILRIYGSLSKDSSILEIGCGLGRIAFPLRYVLFDGLYCGFDIAKRKIDFLNKHFSVAHPQFQFKWVDIKNTHYNPGGVVEAKDFTFPYTRQVFDIVFGASLFTHMIPENTARYMRETKRVLKPAGRALFSFFLLDNYDRLRSRRLEFSKPSFNFDHEYQDYGNGFAISDPSDPELMTAYSRRLITTLADQAGLQIIDPILPGLWSNRFENWVGAQDVVVLGHK
jgi:SAM-dependent methyltransferase